MIRRILLILTLIAPAALVQAQTQQEFNLTAYGNCGDPNSSACYVIYMGTVPQPYVSPNLNPEGTGDPWVNAVYENCFYPAIPYTFHTGNRIPVVPTPQVGHCTGTFFWGDGAANRGTLTLELTCRFDTFLAPYQYSTTCHGDDGQGQFVTFTHILGLLGPRRWGAWGWGDHHGTMDISVNIP